MKAVLLRYSYHVVKTGCFCNVLLLGLGYEMSECYVVLGVTDSQFGRVFKYIKVFLVIIFCTII